MGHVADIYVDLYNQIRKLRYSITIILYIHSFIHIYSFIHFIYVIINSRDFEEEIDFYIDLFMRISAFSFI